MSHRTLLVDDEPTARQRLRELLEDYPQITVVAEAQSAAEAVRCVASQSPDLMFVDIQLADGDGFQLLHRLQFLPTVVFTTAHDQYAVRAFEVGALDYLLKPIDSDAIERVIGKLKYQVPRKALPGAAAIAQPTPAQYVTKVAVRLGKRIFLINLAEVTHFYAKDKYVFMSTLPGKEYIIDYTIAELQQRLDPQQFVRVHRSCITNIGFIGEIHSWFGGKYRLIMCDKEKSEIVMSKNMAANLKAIVPF